MVLVEPFVLCCQTNCSKTFCLACFAIGSETEVHRNDHPYSIQRDSFTLFTGSDWSAREEKDFLDLMFSFGVGNWDEISSNMKCRLRSSEQCRTHFNKFYFDGIFKRRLGLTNEDAYFRHKVPYIFKSNRIEPPRGGDKNFIFQSMSGYLFARSEFNVPYDNSAESILSSALLDNVDASENDKDCVANFIQNELNCALIRAYNHRLKERARRYRIVQNHGLILQRKTLAWLSQYSEMLQERIEITKLTAFVQISDPMSFDFLLESIKLHYDKKRSLNQ